MVCGDLRNNGSDGLRGLSRVTFDESLQKDLEMNLPYLPFKLLLEVDQAIFL